MTKFMTFLTTANLKVTPKKLMLVAIVLCVLGVATIPIMSYLQPKTSSYILASVNVLEGKPQIKLAHSGDYNELSNSQEVAQGDSIKTDDTSSAIVFFLDNASLLIEKNSEVVLDHIATQSQNQISITQIIGQTWSKVIKNTGTQYEVKSDTAVASVRGTIFSVTVDAAHNSTIKVTESTVSVGTVYENKVLGPETDVTSGNEVTVEKEKVLSYTDTSLKEGVKAQSITPDNSSLDDKTCISSYLQSTIASQGSLLKKSNDLKPVQDCISQSKKNEINQDDQGSQPHSDNKQTGNGSTTNEQTHTNPNKGNRDEKKNDDISLIDPNLEATPQNKKSKRDKSSNDSPIPVVDIGVNPSVNIKAPSNNSNSPNKPTKSTVSNTLPIVPDLNQSPVDKNNQKQQKAKS